MKKALLFTALLFQITFVLGQTCEQRLKTVIDGFYAFKSCSQRAEMNRLLRLATTVIDECPLYYAEHEKEFTAAKKFVETTYDKLGCQAPGVTGTGTGTGTNAGAGAASGNQMPGVNSNIAAIGDVATQLAGTIDAAIAAKKAKKKQTENELFGANVIENKALINAFGKDLLNTFGKYGTLTDYGRKEDNALFLFNKTNTVQVLHLENLTVLTLCIYSEYSKLMQNNMSIKCETEDMFKRLLAEKPYQKFVNPLTKIDVDKKELYIRLNRISIPEYDLSANNQPGTPAVNNAFDPKGNEPAAAVNTDATNALTILKTSLNAGKKNLNEITQNVINYLKARNLPVLYLRASGELTLYYLNYSEKVYIGRYSTQNELVISFAGEFVDRGKDFYKQIDCPYATVSTTDMRTSSIYTITIPLNGK